MDRWALLNEEPQRGHLGASGIGKKCARDKWLSFRWAHKPAFEGRMQRLFQFGHQSEERFVAELRSIGFEVFTNKEPGMAEKLRFLGYKGHFAGECDAIIGWEGKWFLGEFKTLSDKSWNDTKSKGVETSKPHYWTQVHVYMGEMNLPGCLWLAENKNNQDLYVEWIKYDPAVHEEAKRQAAEIIDADKAPGKIGSGKPDWYECKFCDSLNVCHGMAMPKVNCRTCCWVTAADDGQWTCGKGPGEDRVIIPDEVSRKGCEQHLFNPTMLPWEAIDGDHDWIEYQLANGRRMVNCTLTGFPTLKLSDPPDLIATSQQLLEVGSAGKIETTATVTGEFGGKIENIKQQGEHQDD